MDSTYKTTQEVAAQAGVTVHAILQRAKTLGLTPCVRGIAFWSPEQVEKLVQAPPRGRPKHKPKEQA